MRLSRLAARGPLQHRICRCLTMTFALVLSYCLAVSGYTAGVRAEVEQDSIVFLPIVVRQPPATGPLSVQLTLDRAHSVQQVVPPAGGVLNVTGADGTRFSLAISDRSLPVTRTITMTVVGAVQGLPFSGGLGGAVHLEPQGLLFLEPAILTIAPATPIAPDRQTFFAFDGAGQEFRLHPPVLDPANRQAIRLPVYHFSGVGVASGTAAERGAALQHAPSAVADQISQQIGELVRSERAAQLANQPGDPEFWTRMLALAGRYYAEVVQPVMQQGFSTACHGVAGQRALTRAVSVAIGWERSLQLLGVGDDFMAAERASVRESLYQALGACWMDATNPCLDWRNPAQVERVFALAREAQLLNYMPELFNPYNVRQCVGCEWAKVVSDWIGSAEFNYQNHSSRTEYGTTTTAEVARSAKMEFMMPDSAPWGGRERWNGNATGGMAEINDRVVDTSQYGNRTQTWTGSGDVNLTGSYASYAKMNIDPARCTYSAEFHPYRLATYTNDGVEESRLPRLVGTPYLFELPLPDTSGRVLKGSLALTAVGDGPAENTYTHFEIGSTGGVAELGFALGAGNLGTAPVEWSLSPAPYW